jgi:uncharacterized protein (DUF2267 family)
MSTGLDTFDKTVQESNLWLKDIMDRLDTADRHHAYSTLRAVLHALRDRIGAESAAHLGAQLPMLLRGLYYEGWDPTGKPSKERHEDAFLGHIARELPRAAEGEVEEGTLAVLDVLSKHIGRGLGHQRPLHGGVELIEVVDSDRLTGHPSSYRQTCFFVV